MIKINMSVTPTTQELKSWVEGWERDIMGNLTPFWDKVAQPLVAEEIARVFATQGYGTWAPLSEKYAYYKSRMFPGRTILRRKDTYFRASTRKGEGNVYERNKDMMEWGVDLAWFGATFGFPYPAIHEQGGTKSAMPARPVFELAAQSKELSNNLVVGLRNYVGKRIEAEARKYFK